MFETGKLNKKLACFSAIHMSYTAFCGASICISHQTGATSDKHFV
jgi:hypothetical protein